MKSLAIGTASLGLTDLPAIIADRKSYLKDDGLSVEISAFVGGSKTLKRYSAAASTWRRAPIRTR